MRALAAAAALLGSVTARAEVGLDLFGGEPPDDVAQAEKKLDAGVDDPVLENELVDALARRAEYDAEQTEKANEELAEFDYLAGLGTRDRTDAGINRNWELMNEVAFGNRHVLTDRFEAAFAFLIPNLTSNLRVVLRAGLAIAANTDSGFYVTQSLAFGVGLRRMTAGTRFVGEFGLRFMSGLEAPGAKEPGAQSLALDATLTSGAADDARWQPISNFGMQAYLDFMSRTPTWFLGTAGNGRPRFTLAGGVNYGGRASVVPLRVHTWLGTELQLLANVYLEPYFGLGTLNGNKVNLQLGAHVELSLSSIWPADAPLPLVVGGFLAWSPERLPFTLRLFTGWGGSPMKSFEIQYGARLSLFF